FKGSWSISTSSCCKTFDRVEIISSVPSSVIRKISLISSMVNGSEKMLRSLNEISCSSSHALAFLQDVQLGEVYRVNIKLPLLILCLYNKHLLNNNHFKLPLSTLYYICQVKGRG